MTTRTLNDGTPIPSHLAIAHAEAGAVAFEASRVAVALRDLSAALSDPDDPIPEEYRPGLCEAVALIGDYVEGWATGRHATLESVVREAHAEALGAPEPRKQARRRAEEVAP